MNLQEASDTSAIVSMMKTLKEVRPHNRKRRNYYDCKQVVQWPRRDSVPDGMRRPEAYIGWARIAIDTIAERLRLIGYRDGEASGIDAVLAQGGNEEEIRIAISDSLLYGVGFLSLSAGDTREEIRITAENASATTVLYDHRTREPRAAITMTGGHATRQEYRGWYHTKEVSVPFIVNGDKVAHDASEGDIVEHGYGFVPIMAIVNKKAATGHVGRSELSESMLGYIDQAVVTLLEMAVNRSLYANPKIIFTGTSADMFRKESGGPVDLGPLDRSIVNLPVNRQKDGSYVPSATQLSPGSPQPFTEVIRQFEQLFRSEAKLPMSRMSNNASGNPTSAEALLAEEGPLNLYSEGKILSLIPQFRELGRNILTLLGVTDRKQRERYAEPIFAEPQFISASPDVIALVTAGILQPNSFIVQQRIGLSKAEAAHVAAENTAAGTREVLRALGMTEDGEEAPTEDGDANG